MSDIQQLDGCDSVSTSSTDSHSDTVSEDELDDSEDEDDMDNDQYSSIISGENAQEQSQDDHDHVGVQSEDQAYDTQEDSQDEDEHDDGQSGDQQHEPRPEVPPPWYEQYTKEQEHRTPILRRINTNDRVAISAELPTIAATNTRSIFPKIRNFSEDIIQRKITVCFISETWEQETNSKFQKEVEIIFEMKGLQFISCHRPKNRRGGGAAIVVNTEKFHCEKLDVLVPGNLECVWATLRPKHITKETKFKQIILCGFYSPPKSRKNAKLLDHLISTMHILMTKYPDCGWVTGGDKNKCPLAPILAALPMSRQLVTQPTYKKTNMIYDVLVTNMGRYYQIPYIAKAVDPDDSTSKAVPSDHDCAVAEPLAEAGGGSTREYSVRTSQPFPQSGIRQFGTWLHTVRWDAELTDDKSATEMALQMEERLRVKVKEIFPTKTVRLSNEDKPFFSAALKKLDKYVKKEYKQRGKSEKYIKLKSAYDVKYKKAAKHYLDGCIEDMMEEAPGKAYRALKKLGARPGDCGEETGFTITSHVEQNLSPQQSVEQIADYFSSISQQYAPLNLQELPERLRAEIEAPSGTYNIPKIEAWEVWETMKMGRKTKSSVPGELPAKLRHEFGPEIAEPASIIFNKIATSGEWPEHWKEGSAVPLKKVPAPTDESETRLIEITNYLSLQMEKIVLKWLYVYISDKLDRDQFGGAKGHSVAHYLIEVMNFVLYNQDLSEPVSTILTAVDIHKGFNKIEHLKIIRILGEEMKVPGWLLKIVSSYLSSRKLTIRYRRETSTSRPMPGGTAAGTILGLTFFLVIFNGAGPATNCVSIGKQITQPRKKRKPIEKTKVKWVDDVTLCTAVNLKKLLVPEDRAVPRPLPYHARTEQRLPRNSNPMQDELDNLCLYTDSHKMTISKNKTKAMLCNSRVKWDCVPELNLKNEHQIEVVEEMKIVGYLMRSDMKTCANTAYLVSKAYKRMWLIRRLKGLGASTVRLVDALQKQVLSVLWLGAPAWFCQTTQQERTDIDRVAKVGLRIIYGDSYSGFESSLLAAKIRKPTEQMKLMTEKFAIKSSKHCKFSQWFQPAPVKSIRTRNGRNLPKYASILARTARYQNSPIPVLTRILNEKHHKQQQ